MKIFVISNSMYRTYYTRATPDLCNPSSLEKPITVITGYTIKYVSINIHTVITLLIFIKI